VFKFELSTTDLAASRFTVSPMHETLEALTLLTRLRTDAVLRSWVERRRPALMRLQHRLPMVSVLCALVDTPGYEYSPDFLAPPAGLHTTPETQLDLIRSTPPGLARTEFDRYLADQRASRSEPSAATTAALGRPDAVQRLADALEASWRELIRPDWPMIKAVLQRDLQHRATLLLAGGWDATLPSLSPEVGWHTGTFEAPPGPAAGPVAYDHPADQGGFLFGPSVFGTTTFTLAEPWPRTMLYPAVGRAHLAGGPPPPDRAVARLIGHTRACILEELDHPATTTQLTQRLHAGLGTIGNHIAALRASGLIIGTRAGQRVYYRRTPLADALLEGAAGWVPTGRGSRRSEE
jgi:DNA-binding transcriptional ArsR family regulator